MVDVEGTMMMAKDKPPEGKKPNKSKRIQMIDEDVELFCVYLHHFKGIDPYRQYEVFDRRKCIYKPGDFDQVVQDRLVSVIDSAVNSDIPQYYSGPHDLMLMRRKSIFAFAVESDTTLSQNGEIKFTSYKGNVGYHTFDRCKYFSRRIANKMFYIAYCTNHMKSTDGGDLSDLEWERFSIELPFQGLSKDGRDPGTGGTNMGPPVPPPDRKKRRR